MARSPLPNSIPREAFYVGKILMPSQAPLRLSFVSQIEDSGNWRHRDGPVFKLVVALPRWCTDAETTDLAAAAQFCRSMKVAAAAAEGVHKLSCLLNLHFDSI